MKRWLILAALVVALTATATVAVQYLPSSPSPEDMPVARKADGPAPRVVVEGPLLFKFEAKPQHETFKRDWLIKNEGEGDLILHKASSTCSCTVAEFDQKASSDGETAELHVKPGKSVTIHFTFETREFEGHYLKSATVATNDPATPQLTFGAEGMIHPALVLMPPGRTVEFGSISNDVDHPTRIALFSPDRPGFKVTKATSSKPGLLVATFEPLTNEEREMLPTKPTAGYRINVVAKPGLTLGVFREEISLTTNHPKEPELRLTVVGKVVGPITVIPESVRMLDVKGSEGKKTTVMLMVRGLRETKFTVAEKPAKVNVEIVPASDKSKGSYRMTVAVPPGTPAEDVEDQIILKTDHPQAETVKIPVSIYIRDQG